MTKKLNENKIINELHGESAFFQKTSSEQEVDEQQAISANESPVTYPDAGLTDQSTSQSSTESSGGKYDTSPILQRPKAFYITEKQVEDLDILVKKLGKKLDGKGGLKMDRSVVMRLILEATKLTDEETVEKLERHMTNRLVSQLTGRQP